VPVTYATLPPLRTSTSSGVEVQIGAAEPNFLTVGRKVDSSLAGLKVALSHMFAGGDTIATDKVTDGGRKISCVSDGGYQPHRLPYAPPPKPLGLDSRQCSPAPHCTCLSDVTTSPSAQHHRHYHHQPIDQWEMSGCPECAADDYCRSCSTPAGLNSPPPHNKPLEAVKFGSQPPHYSSPPAPLVRQFAAQH